tara:strand:+ start:21 stop:569 length:549 start_codon:yes stop_codon:yes gene_type:complete
MSKSLDLIYKYASVDKVAKKKKRKRRKKDYPFSRAYQSALSFPTLGLTRAIQQRATLGRAAVGTKGLTTNEAKIVSKLQGETPVNTPWVSKILSLGQTDAREKTYPVSRFLTHPGTSTAIGAVIGGAGKGLPGAVAGGIESGVGGLIDRTTHARASLGRAALNRRGTWASDREVLRILGSKG